MEREVFGVLELRVCCGVGVGEGARLWSGGVMRFFHG